MEVLHGSHVAWQEQKIPFPMGKEVLSFAKYFHCSCHATWLPCKTSIRPVSRQVLLVLSFDVLILYTVAYTHAAIE